MTLPLTYHRRDRGGASVAIRRALPLLLLIYPAFPFGFGVNHGVWHTRATLPSVGRRDAPDVSWRRHAKKGKKKKGGGGKGKQKQSGFAWAQDFTLMPFESAEGRSLSAALCSSFEGRTGRRLDPAVDPAGDVPKMLWNSKETCAVVVSSDAPSTTVKYANLAALECFALTEKEFERLIGTEEPLAGRGTLQFPGNLPADSKGYESGYTKKVWKSNPDAEGTDGPNGDITLRNACRWILERPAVIDGKLTVERLGVAYAWSRWTEGDEDVDVDGTRMSAVDPADLAARIEGQAAYVRKLKEEDGLGNKDEEVVRAVAKLLKLKEMMPK